MKNRNEKTIIILNNFINLNYYQLYELYGSNRLSQQQVELLKLSESEGNLVIKKYRQSGSTTLLTFIAMIELIRGKEICFLSKNKDLSREMNKKIVNWLKDVFQNNIELNTTPNKIEFLNGYIYFLIFNPNNLHGYRYDLCIYDEFYTNIKKHNIFDLDGKIDTKEINEFIHLSSYISQQYIISTNQQPLYDLISNHNSNKSIKLEWWLDGRFNDNLYWMYKKDTSNLIKAQPKTNLNKCIELLSKGFTPYSPWSDKITINLINEEVFNKEFR